MGKLNMKNKTIETWFIAYALAALALIAIHLL